MNAYAVFVVNVVEWLLRFEGVRVWEWVPNALGPFDGLAAVLLDGCNDFVGGGCIAVVVDRDVISARRSKFRGRGTDASARAGDQHNGHSVAPGNPRNDGACGCAAPAH